MSDFCLLVMFAAHRMRNLTTSSLKNTIFLSHFSATQNSNSCRNSAYMARKKWLDAHTWAYTAPPLLRIPRVQWPASLARRKWKWGLTPSKYYRKATHINSLLSSFRRLNNSNFRFSKGKKELMLAATSKRAPAFQVGAVCYMLCFMSCVMRKFLFPERASTM